MKGKETFVVHIQTNYTKINTLFRTKTILVCLFYKNETYKLVTRLHSVARAKLSFSCIIYFSPRSNLASQRTVKTGSVGRPIRGRRGVTLPQPCLCSDVERNHALTTQCKQQIRLSSVSHQNGDLLNCVPVSYIKSLSNYHRLQSIMGH